RRRGGDQSPTKNLLELDHHPVRSIKEASRYLIEVAATPPRRGGENCGPLCLGNSPASPWGGVVVGSSAALNRCAPGDIFQWAIQFKRMVIGAGGLVISLMRNRWPSGEVVKKAPGVTENSGKARPGSILDPFRLTD